jgi:DNA-directed RNA polymerase subunit RPC12/RpoP
VSDRSSEQNEICQICYIKFNELDEHQTIADKIRLDLSCLYNASHFHSTDVLKVKIEPVDLPSPDNDDNDAFESDFNPDERDLDDDDDTDSDSSAKMNSADELQRKFKPVKVSSIKQHRRRSKQSRQKFDLSDENIKEHSLNGHIVYQCMVCKKTTSKKGAIRQHARIHTSERNICCPECGKMFKTPSCLYSHKKIHQKNNRMIW